LEEDGFGQYIWKRVKHLRQEWEGNTCITLGLKLLVDTKWLEPTPIYTTPKMILDLDILTYKIIFYGTF
jgi:hypothetical protein